MKILFTDLDGTLLNEHSRLSPLTMEILGRFLAAGNKLVLSSGRPLDSILEVKDVAELNYSGIYIAACNGCQIYECDTNSIIRSVKLPRDMVSILQKEACEAGIHIHTYTDNEIVSIADDEEIRYYTVRIHMPVTVSNDFAEYLVDEPYKMLAIHLTDHAKIASFAESINKKYGNKIQSIFSSDKYLEFFDVMGGKGSAVKWLCDYLDISISDAYAAGDAENDISMIVEAGVGIAMKNGDDKVKESADVVTEFDNTEDGLAKYIETIL